MTTNSRAHNNDDDLAATTNDYQRLPQQQQLQDSRDYQHDCQRGLRRDHATTNSRAHNNHDDHYDHDDQNDDHGIASFVKVMEAPFNNTKSTTPTSWSAITMTPSFAPYFILANFVPKPIQGVVEDQFLIGHWPIMRTLFCGLFTIYNFLIDPQRSRGLRVAAPWCVEHAVIIDGDARIVHMLWISSLFAARCEALCAALGEFHCWQRYS